jgi:hypothetical protein
LHNESFLLIQAAAGDVVGMFSNGPTGVIDGVPYTITYTAGPLGQQDVVLTVVPEPSSLVLGLLGAAGLWAAYRRRRSFTT